MTKNEQDVNADLIIAVVGGDVSRVRAVVSNPSFEKNNQEILVSLRVAIQGGMVDIVKLFDETFTLDMGNDTKTVALAAEAHFEIFQLLAEHEKPLKQDFSVQDHPLVIAFKAGNVAVAEWLVEWADANNVDPAVKAAALLEGSRQGNVEVCKLYAETSDENLSVVIGGLIRYGHSAKVKEFVDSSSTDFSYGDFKMLRACSAHYDAMAAIIRHPSVQKGLPDLCYYYRVVNACCRASFDKDLAAVKKDFGKRIKHRAAELVRATENATKTITEPDATNIATQELKAEYKRLLRAKKLDAYAYSFE
jgi:hypothetical protein